jgi:hypothetical protein
MFHRTHSNKKNKELIAVEHLDAKLTIHWQTRQM